MFFAVVLNKDVLKEDVFNQDVFDRDFSTQDVLWGRVLIEDVS